MKSTGVPVALIGLKHRDLQRVVELKRYSAEYIQEAEAMFIRLAEKHHIPLYPSFFAGLTGEDYLNLKKDYGDLLHFNGENYRVTREEGQWEIINAIYDYASGIEQLHPNAKGQKKISDQLILFLVSEGLIHTPKAKLQEAEGIESPPPYFAKKPTNREGIE